MNNIFRIIWNRSLGRMVVASEAAQAKGKASTLTAGVIGQLPAPDAAGRGA